MFIFFSSCKLFLFPKTRDKAEEFRMRIQLIRNFESSVGAHLGMPHERVHGSLSPSKQSHSLRLKSRYYLLCEVLVSHIRLIIVVGCGCGAAGSEAIVSRQNDTITYV